MGRLVSMTRGLVRTFVAVSLPEGLRRDLAPFAAAVARVAEWRTTPLHQWHVTLRFVGEVDAAAAAAIDDACARIRIAPFECRLDGVGTFPDVGPPRVLWFGVRAEPQDPGGGDPLRDLADAVDRACDPIVGGRDRPFVAHVTLGRLRRPVPAADVARLRAAVAELGRWLPTAGFVVRTFERQVSERGMRGVVHRVVSEFGLR